jgi:hypothetical protein
MRLDLEVLALAEDVLRAHSDQATGAEQHSFAEWLEETADALADIIDHLDQDG